MKIVIDTNAYVSFCKGEDKAVSVVQISSHIYLPVICAAELRAGFLCGSQAITNEKSLIRFLNSPRVNVLYLDEQTIHHYARLFYQLRKQGTPIPTNDLWIAALVCQHNLTLFSQDKHFDHLPQIPRF